MLLFGLLKTVNVQSFTNTIRVLANMTSADFSLVTKWLERSPQVMASSFRQFPLNLLSECFGVLRALVSCATLPHPYSLLFSSCSLVPTFVVPLPSDLASQLTPFFLPQLMFRFFHFYQTFSLIDLDFVKTIPSLILLGRNQRIRDFHPLKLISYLCTIKMPMLGTHKTMMMPALLPSSRHISQASDCKVTSVIITKKHLWILVYKLNILYLTDTKSR